QRSLGRHHVLAKRMTQGCLAGLRPWLRQALLALEELSVAVNQRDQRHGYPEQLGGQAGEAVELWLRTGVEDREILQGRQPGAVGDHVQAITERDGKAANGSGAGARTW